MVLLCSLVQGEVDNKKGTTSFKIHCYKERKAQPPPLLRNDLSSHILLSSLFTLRSNYNFYNIKLCAHIKTHIKSSVESTNINQNKQWDIKSDKNKHEKNSLKNIRILHY